MTKLEFVSKLNAVLGQLKGVNVNTLEQFDYSLTADQSTAVLSAITKVVRDELAETGEATLPGLVTLTVAERGERLGHNPLTGEKISLPAKKFVKAKVLSPLRGVASNAPIYVAPLREQSEAQKANTALLRQRFEEKRAAAA